MPRIIHSARAKPKLEREQLGSVHKMAPTTAAVSPFVRAPSHSAPSRTVRSHFPVTGAPSLRPGPSPVSHPPRLPPLNTAQHLYRRALKGAQDW